jgi:phosphohistidine swiveling domain-containing protein
LRASLSSTTRRDYPGYSFILAIYEDGVERYFISADEAENTAKWLINRSVSQPSWLEAKLHAIEDQSKKLAEAFDHSITSQSLRETRTDDLVTIYLRHNSLHSELYRYARIPEALDRGSPFFSDYLRTYLTKIGVTDTELPCVFQALTAPRVPSVIAEEERAFRSIATDTLDCCPDLFKSHTPHMLLPSPVRDALRFHRERWGWLSYHGYRNRTLPTEGDYICRLRDTQSAKPPNQACQVSDLDQSDFTNCGPLLSGIDRKHRELFRLYSEIGRVKLFRRYWQLRNFYFLDQLLEEFACRLDATEWEVRCCAPEELLEALHRGRLDPSVKRRTHRCAVLYSTDGEIVFDGEDVAALLDSVRIRKKPNDGTAARRGTPACIGFARGTARIVGQSHDQWPTFQSGDVLVCEAADPDLLPMIRQAAAVLTQQGGVTSHASVLCREIGVPTIIGIEDLLTLVRDGDEVEVDATRGVVKLIAGNQQTAGKGLVVPVELWDRPEFVGQKASNLRLAIKRGFKVPPFTLLSFEAAVRMLEEDEGTLRSELLDLTGALGSNTTSTPSFLLRSSAQDEDGVGESRTGLYASIPLRSDPVKAVREFVQRNSKLGYKGVVLLQRFLPASICGVSVDGDPRADAEHKLIVEFVRGPINTVTDGRGQLERFVYDYRSRKIIAAIDGGSAQSAIGDFPAGQLVEWLSSAGSAFGKPAYTEWGFFGGEYWLYQVRGAIF